MMTTHTPVSARLPGLAVARSQAEQYAEELAAEVPPFDWFRTEPRAKRVPARLAVAAALTLTLLGGLTWAVFSPRPVVSEGWLIGDRVREFGMRPDVSVIRKLQPATPATSVLVEERPVRKPRAHRPRAASAKASVGDQSAITQAPATRREPLLKPEGSVILVRPRSKLGPLFSPEQFKRRYRGP